MNRFEVDGKDVGAALRTPLIEQLASHASVRSFNLSRPLPDTLVEVLVAAAQSASTSSNLQTWSVVEVSSPERRQAMRAYCANQASVEEAPLFLVFCADTYRSRWVTARQGYAFGSDYLELLLVSVIDSALACQNATAAAESLGLGCCMIGAVRNHPLEVSKLLGLPQGVVATIGLVVGYPANRNPVKPRLPQSVVLHKEQYATDAFESDIVAYDARMKETGIYDGRRVQIRSVTPEPDTAPYGWIEHTARRMARGNDVRRGLGKYLRELGFILE